MRASWPLRAEVREGEGVEVDDFCGDGGGERGVWFAGEDGDGEFIGGEEGVQDVGAGVAGGLAVLAFEMGRREGKNTYTCKSDVSDCLRHCIWVCI